MIIDFLGFGGTGKSTFLRALYAKLKSEGYEVEIFQRPVFKNPISIFKWCLFLLLNPSTFVKARKLIKLIKQERSDFKYLETLKRISLYSLSSNHTSQKIILSDEGLSIYLQHLKLKNIDYNLKKLLPEVLISLYVTENERLYRVYERGGLVAQRRMFDGDQRLEILKKHALILLSNNDNRLYEHFKNLNNTCFLNAYNEVQLKKYADIFEYEGVSIFMRNSIKEDERNKFINHLNLIDKYNALGIKTFRFNTSNYNIMNDQINDILSLLKTMNIKTL